MLGVHVHYCLVDNVVKFHGGVMKIEQVITMYMKVRSILFYPQCLATVNAQLSL